MTRLAVPISFHQLHEKAVMPEYKTSGAAAVDLVATEIEYLDENKVEVRFGFSTEFSDSYKVLLQPRSSFTLKGWVMQNSPGIIDSDYRGEWKVRFEAIPIGINPKMSGFTFLYEEFPYKVGDRIVQATLEVSVHMKFRSKKELSHTLRGEGGFGHTGK